MAAWRPGPSRRAATASPGAASSSARPAPSAPACSRSPPSTAPTSRAPADDARPGRPPALVRAPGRGARARPVARLLRRPSCNTGVVSRRFAGQASAALVAVLLCAAALTGGAPATVPKRPTGYLALAEKGLANTQRAFWNPQLHWYDWRLLKAHPPQPPPSLSAGFPLLELVDPRADPPPPPRH